jgi:hypothetical protein
LQGTALSPGQPHEWFQTAVALSIGSRQRFLLRLSITFKLLINVVKESFLASLSESDQVHLVSVFFNPPIPANSPDSATWAVLLDLSVWIVQSSSSYVFGHFAWLPHSAHLIPQSQPEWFGVSISMHHSGVTVSSTVPHMLISPDTGLTIQQPRNWPK